MFYSSILLVRNFILSEVKQRSFDMEMVKGSEDDLASFNREELKTLFHRINTRLAKGLLNGANLNDQQENIRMLSKISEELNRRKNFPGTNRNPEGLIRS